MSLLTSFAGLAVCRFLLGAFEAGLFPGIIYYMSLWYPKREQARRLGFFWSFGSLSGAFGGLLAFGIQQIPADKLASWQWLFCYGYPTSAKFSALSVIEGLPTVILAIAVVFILPDSPEKAKFFTEEERDYAIRRLATDAGVAHDNSWSWGQVWSVFTDWKTYAYMIIYLSGTAALQGVTLFLPSIINGLGKWSKVTSQLLTTPPYFAAFLGTLALGWSSDRFLERAFHMVANNIFTMAGFLILMFVDSALVGVTYFGAIIVTVGVYANVAVKITWFNNNYGGLTRRAVASAAIVSVGSIGGAIGGQIYYDAPKYFNGHAIAISCMAAQTVFVVILRFVFAYENSRRERLTEREKAAEIDKYGGTELAGDRHPDFRYTL
ncbi:major facilitator superfamily domain-containing protein [Jimgerdemannia flammicorona]|uniref:Major facilitator superfamily domain-containing protein n=1 Tax=Jimgerdemannia flammicorona TaxID=994334 RepID=A0A433PBQ8_9FUNG|nr:major facilitator superfamily domain-containing protein [Jimgerdemannia flammicorona]